MRKKLLVALLCWGTAVAMFAGKEDSYILHEGFEQDTFPRTWTQEYGTSYEQDWLIESGADAQYPQGAAEGGSYIALRNQTTQTQHFVTRLVSPVFDISETLQPILIFSHAQMQRTGDVDILRVYYRTSSQSRWVQIGEYTQKTMGWVEDTIALVAQNATYQIAFEGTDQMGRGIALDNIIVRPTPTCDNPYNISTDGLTASTVTLRWLGSLDTDSFLVALSKTAQTDPYQPVNIDTTIVVSDFECFIDGLERNTRYYAYILAYCGASESEWASASFNTKNIDTIPYVQSFDKPYVQGLMVHADFWTHGTSILQDDGSQEFMPFINTLSTESSRSNYSYNATSCLAFTGGRDMSTEIPRGQYVYAATPELDVEDVSALQVAFWGTGYTNVSEDLANGLIVGVMSDPADFSTFVAVDTVYLAQERTYYYYVVRLDKYAGTGKYVAFASNFTEKENIFFLDEVEITEAPELPYVTDVEVLSHRAESFVLQANLNGASQVQVVVTNDVKNGNGKPYRDPSSIAQDNWLVDTVLAATDFPYTVHLPQGGKFVQVYVRATNGTDFGQWTLPHKVQVPMQISAYPFATSFEIATPLDPSGVWEAKAIQNYTTLTSSYSYPNSVYTRPQVKDPEKTASWPFIYSSYSYDQKYALILGKEYTEWSQDNLRSRQEVGDYVAFAAVDTIQDAVLQFYMRDYTSSVPGLGCAVVGVMSDPFDPSTFDTVATVRTYNDEYVPQIVTFSSYQGSGRFIAIMATESGTTYRYSSTSGSGGSYTTYRSSSMYIDKVSIYKQGECILPSNIQVEAGHESVDLSWDGHGMNQWKVYLYDSEDATQAIDSAVVDSTSYRFENLAPHTEYYYSVITICGETQTEDYRFRFTTACVPAEALPYSEDFSTWSGSSSTPVIEPSCWTIPRYRYVYSQSESYSPYISTLSGSPALYLGVSSSSQVTNLVYAALPLMADSIQKLQLTLWADPSFVGDTLYVGAMSDRDDVTTLDTIAALRLTKESMEEYIVTFDSYQGQGQYITLFIPAEKRSRGIYIDNVEVRYRSTCAKVQNVVARNMTESSAQLHWQTEGASEWEIVVASEELVLGDTLPTSDTIVYSATTTTMPYQLPDTLQANTAYYVYVRALCSATDKGDWSRPYVFKTICVPLSAGEIGVIDFAAADVLDCWTVGMREGGTSYNMPKRLNNYLYMFNTSTTDGAYAIMPPIAVDSLSRMEVTFRAHGGSGLSYLRELVVGVITNPSDLSTFTAISTLNLTRVSSTSSSDNYGFDEAEWYTVRFDNYFGDYNGDYGTQIMFLSESGENYNYIYIDDISVDTIASCAQPVQVAVEANTYDANIQWEDLGSGAYQVRVLLADEVVADTIVSDTTVVSIDSLSMLTEYSVEVRHICQEGDTSKWSLPVTFRTECPTVFPLPYSEDFENYATGAGNLPDCWEGLRIGSSTLHPYVYSSAKKDGARGLYIYRNSSVGSVAVLPAMSAPIAQLMLSFDYRNASTTYKSYLVVGVASDISSFEAIDTTLTVLDSIEIAAYKAPNNVWYHYAQTLESYTGGGGSLVLYAPKADVSANGGAIYLDNLYIEKIPTCFRPIDLTFVSAQCESITIQWKPMGEETAWDIACVEEDADLATASVLTVQDSVATITNLIPGVDYRIYVRANCGEGDVSEWSDVEQARTLSRVALSDAYWDFDYPVDSKRVPLATTDAYVIDKNWVSTGTDASSTSYPYHKRNTYHSTSGTRDYHYALSDSCALYIFGSSTADAYAIAPAIEANLDSLQVRFFARSVYARGSKVTNTDSTYYTTYATGTTYIHSIKVGVTQDPYDLSTVEELVDIELPAVSNKTIVEGDHWQEIIVPLYGVKGQYVTLYTDYGKSNYVYVDNVRIEPSDRCHAPNRLAVPELTYHSAAFAWVSPATAFEVRVTSADTLVASASINDTCAWALEGLESASDYVFEVRAICGVGDTSAWATLALTTPCAPLALIGYEEDFESENVTMEHNNELPECWNYGMVGGISNTYAPKAIANTTTYQYSHNHPATHTSGKALRLYNASSYTDSYVIMPDFAQDGMDTLSLHFWARAAYFYAPTYGTATSTMRDRLNTVNNKYQRTIVIGTVADADDFSSFVARDTFTYSQSWASATGVFAKDDPMGNEYWEEVIVPLKEYKGQGRIAIYYPDNGATSYFFIDDICVISSDYCTPITQLAVDQVGADYASLTWLCTGVDSLCLQVATDEAFEQLIVDSTLVNSNGAFALTDLTQGATYYARAKHYCSTEEESDWSAVVTIVTDRALRFAENFSAMLTYPDGWERATAVPEDVFSGEKSLSAVLPTITSNWRRVAGETFIASHEMFCPTSTTASSSYNCWLLTPTIDLTKVDSAQMTMLTFRLGLTSNAGSIPNASAGADRFLVVVSEDAGETWTADNATIWCDSVGVDAHYSYAALTMEGELFYLDMSRYVGKRIRIAFVNSSQKTASKNYIRLAQVALNYVETTTYAASVCQYEDYEDANFAIDADDLLVDSTTVYSRYDVRTTGADQLTKMALTVHPASTLDMQATICEGESYHLDGFAIDNALRSNVYKQKLQSVDGCDSIVSLSLTVLPRLRTELQQTICQGNYYRFNGVNYYTTIVQTDTLSSQVTGCDSIVTLYLTVNAILSGEQEVHLCPGDSVVFGKFGAIAQSGTYVDTLLTPSLCDSVATLRVFTHETASSYVRAAICQGERYDEGVWSGLSRSGDYPSKQQTIYGCDSIATLHLMVADASLQLFDTIDVAELPYVLNGEELLPVGTAQGVYTRTISLSCGEASVVITVGQPMGIGSVFANTLALTPNPASVGQTVNVLTPLRGKVQVDVLSATGANVYHAEQITSPIHLPGMPVAGVYLVRIVCDGSVYQAKLVVQ